VMWLVYRRRVPWSRVARRVEQEGPWGGCGSRVLFQPNSPKELSPNPEIAEAARPVSPWSQAIFGIPVRKRRPSGA
jgi:hypothetical protein